jgi:hypothetical protein
MNKIFDYFATVISQRFLLTGVKNVFYMNVVMLSCVINYIFIL